MKVTKCNSLRVLVKLSLTYTCHSTSSLTYLYTSLSHLLLSPEPREKQTERAIFPLFLFFFIFLNGGEADDGGGVRERGGAVVEGPDHGEVDGDEFRAEHRVHLYRVQAQPHHRRHPLPKRGRRSTRVRHH